MKRGVIVLRVLINACWRFSLCFVVAGCQAVEIRQADHGDASGSDSFGDSGTPSVDAPLAHSRCDTPGLLLCDDFESDALNPELWTFRPVRANSATATVDTTHPFRGSHSLRVNVGYINAETYNSGMIWSKAKFPIATDHYYVSAYVYLTAAAPTRHFTIMRANSTDKPPPAVGGEWYYGLNVLPNSDKVRGGPNKIRYMAQYGLGYDGLKLKIATFGAPLGRWACWQWELKGTELRFSIDGQPVGGDAPALDWVAPTQAQFSFGFMTSHANSYDPTGYDVWFDDIAISTQPIGCE